MQKIVSSVLLFVVASPLWSADFAGVYNTIDPGEPVTIILEKVTKNQYRGTLKLEDEILQLEAREQSNRLIGKINDYGEWFAFEASLSQQGYLMLTDEDGESWKFQRSQQGSSSESPKASSTATEPSTSSVFVNGQPVPSAKTQSLSQTYGLNIQAGRYWYDANCGAWGLEGGPTVGFIQANLDLPGPMPATISQGGTGIFINGREIHPMDQMGLQQLFGVTYQGRYWLDAYGNLGPEGGPAIVNLLLAINQAQAQQQQAGGGSVTHGYGTTGARGTAAGGMYSGRTASGKSVFWYPGM